MRAGHPTNHHLIPDLGYGTLGPEDIGIHLRPKHVHRRMFNTLGSALIILVG